MSYNLDPEQAKCFVGHDLGPNCLKRLSVDDTANKYSNKFISIEHYTNICYLHNNLSKILKTNIATTYRKACPIDRDIQLCRI